MMADQNNTTYLSRRQFTPLNVQEQQEFFIPSPPINDHVSDGKYFTNLLSSAQNQESTQHSMLNLNNFYDNSNDYETIGKEQELLPFDKELFLEEV